MTFADTCLEFVALLNLFFLGISAADAVKKQLYKNCGAVYCWSKEKVIKSVKLQSEKEQISFGVLAKNSSSPLLGILWQSYSKRGRATIDGATKKGRESFRAYNNSAVCVFAESPNKLE